MIFKTYPILPPEEAGEILKQLLTLPWAEGKARTERLTGTIKQNQEADATNEIVRRLGKYVGEKVIHLEQLQRDWMPKKLSGVRFNRYEGGGTYSRHTDSPLMGEVRSDMACTIFLTDPNEYEGGELCVEIDGHVFSAKGNPGECVVYSCGYPHWVNPVTKGSRISGFTWLQSYVQDQKKREILKNVQALCLALEKEMKPEDNSDKFRKWYVDCGQTHGDLMRMWIEP